MTVISYFNAILIVFFQYFTILSTMKKETTILITTVIIMIIIMIIIITIKIITITIIIIIIIINFHLRLKQTGHFPFLM